jgi:hypothetical protein
VPRFGGGGRGRREASPLCFYEEATLSVIRYLALGILGLALGLVGTLRAIYPLAALGAALIFAAFFWFARTGQGSPAPGKEDDSIPSR